MLYFCSTITLRCYAQTPANDPTWNLAWYDEFNTPGKPNPSNWMNSNPWGPEIGTVTSQTADGYNTNVNDSFLSITGKKGPHSDSQYVFNPRTGVYDSLVKYTSNFTEGNIATGDQFRYGYIEARVRMPDSYSTALYGTWFDNAFWLYGNNPDSNIAHSELDFEIVTGDNPYPNLMECDAQMEVPYGIDGAWEAAHPGGSDAWEDPARFGSLKIDGYPYTSYLNRFQNNNLIFDHGWHIFGYEWLPDQIKFYLDNKLWFRLEGNIPYTYIDTSLSVKTIYPVHLLDIPMNIFLGVGMNGGSLSATGPDSFSFDVDYVRYYTLAENCSTSITQTGYGTAYYLDAPGNYTPQIYNTVTLGQTGCNTCDVEVDSSSSSSSRINIRAEHILLKDGFKVSGNNGFYAHDVDQCPYFIY